MEQRLHDYWQNVADEDRQRRMLMCSGPVQMCPVADVATPLTTQTAAARNVPALLLFNLGWLWFSDIVHRSSSTLYDDLRRVVGDFVARWSHKTHHAASAPVSNFASVRQHRRICNSDARRRTSVEFSTTNSRVVCALRHFNGQTRSLQG